ncbi:hypothetical protein HDV01_005594 [Terramyces sp. JEL0728]|nr:hypothetical protein HDV01_005594 [Terramyces sp. JEL0728]
MSEDYSSISSSPGMPLRNLGDLQSKSTEKKQSYSSIVNGAPCHRQYSDIRFIPLLRSVIGSTSLSPSAILSCGFNSLQEYKERAVNHGLLNRNDVTEHGLKLFKQHEGVSSQLCLFRAAYYEGCRPAFTMLLDATFQIYNCNQSPIVVEKELLAITLDNLLAHQPNEKYATAEQYLRAASSNHYISTKDNIVKINIPPMTTPLGTLLSLFDIMQTHKLDTSHIGGLLNGAFVQYNFVNVKQYLEYASSCNTVCTKEIGKITMVYRLDIFKDKYGFQSDIEYMKAAEEAGILDGNVDKSTGAAEQRTEPRKKDFQMLLKLLQSGPLSSSILGEKLSSYIKNLGYDTVKQFLKEAEKENLVELNFNDKNGNIFVQLPATCTGDAQDTFNPLVSFLQERKGKSSSSQIGEKLIRIIKKLGFQSLKVYLLEAESKGLVKIHNKSDPNGNMFVVLRKDRDLCHPRFQLLLNALVDVEYSTSSFLGPIVGPAVKKFNYKNVKEYLLDAEKCGIVKLRAEDHGSYVVGIVTAKEPETVEKTDSDATEFNSTEEESPTSMLDYDPQEIAPAPESANSTLENQDIDCRQAVDLLTPSIIKVSSSNSVYI